MKTENKAMRMHICTYFVDQCQYQRRLAFASIKDLYEPWAKLNNCIVNIQHLLLVVRCLIGCPTQVGESTRYIYKMHKIYLAIDSSSSSKASGIPA